MSQLSSTTLAFQVWATYWTQLQLNPLDADSETHVITSQACPTQAEIQVHMRFP